MNIKDATEKNRKEKKIEKRKVGIYFYLII